MGERGSNSWKQITLAGRPRTLGLCRRMQEDPCPRTPAWGERAGGADPPAARRPQLLRSLAPWLSGVRSEPPRETLLGAAG